eukprot:ANDGO_02642.mRNA.1 hypothetical protein
MSSRRSSTDNSNDMQMAIKANRPLDPALAPVHTAYPSLILPAPSSLQVPTSKYEWKLSDERYLASLQCPSNASVPLPLSPFVPFSPDNRSPRIGFAGIPPSDSTSTALSSRLGSIDYTNSSSTVFRSYHHSGSLPNVQYGGPSSSSSLSYNPLSRTDRSMSVPSHLPPSAAYLSHHVPPGIAFPFRTPAPAYHNFAKPSSPRRHSDAPFLPFSAVADPLLQQQQQQQQTFPARTSEFRDRTGLPMIDVTPPTPLQRYSSPLMYASPSSPTSSASASVHRQPNNRLLPSPRNMDIEPQLSGKSSPSTSSFAGSSVQQVGVPTPHRGRARSERETHHYAFHDMTAMVQRMRGGRRKKGFRGSGGEESSVYWHDLSDKLHEKE